MYASSVYQTRLHTRSNHLGMLSVGPDPLFQTTHPNLMYKLCVDKCVESIIYSSESQASLTWTSDDRTRTSRTYYINSELYTDAVHTPHGFFYNVSIDYGWYSIDASSDTFIHTPDAQYSSVGAYKKTDIYSNKSCVNLAIGVISDVMFQSCVPYRKSWCSARTRHVTHQLIIQIDQERSVIDVKLWNFFIRDPSFDVTTIC